MKKLFTLIALCLLPIAAFALTPSTEKAQSLTNGLHVGLAPTSRIIFYSPSTTAGVTQPAATSTAYAAMVLEGLIASGSPDYSLQHKRVSLTAANLIGMYAAPVELIPAPGAGKSIVITKLIFTITRTSTAFTGGGAAIVQYGTTVNGGGTQALDSTIAATVITNGAGTTVTVRNGAVISDLAAASIQNNSVTISNATAAFAAGTGTVVADVDYLIQ